MVVSGEVVFVSGDKFSDIEHRKCRNAWRYYQLHYDMLANHSGRARASRANIVDLEQQPGCSGMTDEVPTLCARRMILRM